MMKTDNPTEKSRAVVLLSGGLDSSTCLAIAKSQGFRCYALIFDYGQRHRVELEAAQRVADTIGVEDTAVIRFDLTRFGGSALTDDIDVPKPGSLDDMGDSIPITYVPARNTLFLSFALGWAEVLGAFDIFIGVNALDYSGYPDCRPEFIESFEKTANLATKRGVEKEGIYRIQTPLIDKTKAEIIKTGISLGVDYAITHSCYDPDEKGLSCGRCESCLLRKKGFEDADIPDPTKYVS